mmetsp:Transcript_22644/g.51201  ORF Transcript_22644/g.51201 Transcript_22644/m.51201 type:complete len:219 (-) Transcript_22644:1081-1737(-)
MSHAIPFSTWYLSEVRYSREAPRLHDARSRPAWLHQPDHCRRPLGRLHLVARCMHCSGRRCMHTHVAWAPTSALQMRANARGVVPPRGHPWAHRHHGGVAAAFWPVAAFWSSALQKLHRLVGSCGGAEASAGGSPANLRRTPLASRGGWNLLEIHRDCVGRLPSPSGEAGRTRLGEAAHTRHLCLRGDGGDRSELLQLLRVDRADGEVGLIFGAISSH